MVSKLSLFAIVENGGNPGSNPGRGIRDLNIQKISIFCPFNFYKIEGIPAGASGI